MVVELKALSSLPEFRHRERPHLPVLDTLELIDHMPEGKWEIPQEPYTHWERINDNDLESIKAYKRESFQGRCRELILEWMPFLESAERGKRINLRFIKEHILTTDLDGIRNYNLFHGIFAAKFAADRELKFEDVAASVRNAFLALLTEDQVRSLWHEGPKEVSEQDIENAKYLVHRFGVMI